MIDFCKKIALRVSAVLCIAGGLMLLVFAVEKSAHTGRLGCDSLRLMAVLFLFLAVAAVVVSEIEAVLWRTSDPPAFTAAPKNLREIFRFTWEEDEEPVPMPEKYRRNHWWLLPLSLLLTAIACSAAAALTHNPISPRALLLFSFFAGVPLFVGVCFKRCLADKSEPPAASFCRQLLYRLGILAALVLLLWIFRPIH